MRLYQNMFSENRHKSEYQVRPDQVLKANLHELLTKKHGLLFKKEIFE
jgi:hypothetical protein